MKGQRNQFGMNTLRRGPAGEIEGRADPTEEFELVEKLGEGSYGSVWKAIQRSTKQVYAIKRVPVDDDLEELIEEINAMKQCRHKHVVQYYGSYFKDGELWIVMELCLGGSLMDIMAILGRPLTEKQIAVVMAYVLEGLVYLHAQGKIHRDIKSGNILLNTEGDAKLADFGVSGQLSDTMAKRHTVIGSPFWMAPETIQELGYDQKADIWSLGITAIELAEGNPPYHNLHPMRVIFLIPSRPPPTLTKPSQWSPEFNDFVTKCLTKDPDGRPSSQELLKHPFISKIKKKENVLAPLVSETLEAIESVGGREAALYMDDDDDSGSEGGKDGSPFGGGTMVVSSREHQDEDSGTTRKSGTVKGDTMAVHNGTGGGAQFSEWLEKDAPGEYAKMSTEELQKMLAELEGKMAMEIQAVHVKYADMREKITERISKIE